ncbi:Hypothetical predicted protein [Olea europaea subsp. europaea]|uniref:Uncharacterized protein n=1 Tax=Olea europaea subsp. europaea TaxID=158383 RepID=A0A8S0PUI1_OLEEU|nr:Hypothetical predicted protein [Olea europaea subsp. europaea]
MITVVSWVFHILPDHVDNWISWSCFPPNSVEPCEFSCVAILYMACSKACSYYYELRG